MLGIQFDKVQDSGEREDFDTGSQREFRGIASNLD